MDSVKAKKTAGDESGGLVHEGGFPDSGRNLGAILLAEQNPVQLHSSGNLRECPAPP